MRGWRPADGLHMRMVSYSNTVQVGPKNPLGQLTPTHGFGWVWPFRKTDGLGLSRVADGLGWVSKFSILHSAALSKNPWGPWAPTHGFGWVGVGLGWGWVLLGLGWEPMGWVGLGTHGLG